MSLNYELKRLCHRNKDGSMATQANRLRILDQVASQLREGGFRHLKADSLKEKHVSFLVARWHTEDLSAGTIKNRMSNLRWWAEKVDKRAVIARDNSHYGIADRQFVSNDTKAQQLDQLQLNQVKDPHVRMSLELQREFGLRREEAIKFIPTYADKGDHLQLKPSWTKGGRARCIPIYTDAQRATLDKAHRLAGRGSLIPPQLKYVQQLRIYEKHTASAGLSKMHGLRHEYAQRRYFELTARAAPAAGGLTSKALTPSQKLQDLEVRLCISEELGHAREQITAIYLGR